MIGQYFFPLFSLKCRRKVNRVDFSSAAQTVLDKENDPDPSENVPDPTQNESQEPPT